MESGSWDLGEWLASGVRPKLNCCICNDLWGSSAHITFYVERLLFKLTLNEGEDEYQGTQPKVGDKRLKFAKLGEGSLC